MASISIFNRSGAEVGKYDIEPTDLAPAVNKQLLHDAVVMYQSNVRLGTARSRSRGEVAGSTKKMYRQKGTGGARHGSRRAAQFVGGARAFGPVVRSHAFDLPKKVRALALDAIEKRVASRAADLAPTIKQLQAAGNTTLRALAASLNSMGITTARGGNWDQTQLRRLLARV